MRTFIRLLAIASLCALHIWGSCTAPGPPQTFYVSTSGSNANDGLTPATAFRDIQAGVNCLSTPGDRLLIFPGTYTEQVKVHKKKGEPGNPIVIEGLLGPGPDPTVTIQGTITKLLNYSHDYRFHEGSPAAPNNEWQPLGNGEYVSAHPLPVQTVNPKDWEVNQGAFIDPVKGRHTRLISYSRIEDLRASNETYEAIMDGCPVQDPRPGPVLSTSPQGCRIRRPWVYMGPGLWFDNATKKVHIRLSPTHNNVPGLPDYAGETDPNKLPLAIAHKSMQTLNIEASSHVQFKNLAVKFSAVSIGIKFSSDLSFDNLQVWSGRIGLAAGNASTRLTIANSVFDGGAPTWMFRSDIKEEYKYSLNGIVHENTLGKLTLGKLIGMEGASNAEIHHSEFFNGHDLYLEAPGTNFHHNWIGNMHDDALLLDGFLTAGGAVHHNVIEQSLSAISLAGDYLAGPWYIYRNLIDLRRPTAGFRPFNPASDRAHVWRQGSPFKEGDTKETPNHIFHNTVIVPFAADFPAGQPAYPQASFRHLRNSVTPVQDRSSLNNVFVVLNRELAAEAPLAFHLPPTAPEANVAVNGDLFYRRGYGTQLFATPIPGDPQHFHLFACALTPKCLELWRQTPFFQSAGYEADSILFQDPQFVSWNGEAEPADDFRLLPSSPARGAAVPLPETLRELDTDSAGVPMPDIGAYQTDPKTGFAPALRVGVRSRKPYPM